MEQILKDNEQFIYYLFNLTAGALYLLSYITHLTYQFWNIIIWFGLLPALWIWMISKKTTKWLNVFSIALFAYLFILHTWNAWFDKAVVLLNKLAAYFHSDYRSMSVYICVFLPVLVWAVLSYLFLSKRGQKISLWTIGIASLIVMLLFPISNGVIKSLIFYKDPH